MKKLIYYQEGRHCELMLKLQNQALKQRLDIIEQKIR